MALQIYLASRSPRRAEILKQIGIKFEVIVADIDESVEANELPNDYVLRLAAGKAAKGYSEMQSMNFAALPILAADTTVAIDGMILGKPESDEDAFNMIKSFSGRWHEVHTAIAIASEASLLTALSTTKVEMADVSDDMIHAYIATGESRGKAGAYGIQGYASTFIKRIEGSYSGVMGLPIYETGQLLKELGVKLLTSV